MLSHSPSVCTDCGESIPFETVHHIHGPRPPVNASRQTSSETPLQFEKENPPKTTTGRRAPSRLEREELRNIPRTTTGRWAPPPPVKASRQLPAETPRLERDELRNTPRTTTGRWAPPLPQTPVKAPPAAADLLFENLVNETHLKYCQYAALYNVILDKSSNVARLCSIAQEISPAGNSCVMCNTTDFEAEVRSKVPLFAVDPSNRGGLDDILDRIYRYVKHTYTIRSIHMLCELVSRDIPQFLKEMVVMAKREHVGIDVVKGNISYLSQTAYNRLQSLLEVISKSLPAESPHTLKCMTLISLLNTIVRWIGVGPARDAHHTEVCWYLNRLEATHTKSLLTSSSTIIRKLCRYQQKQLRQLEENNLRISNDEYEKVIAVLRLLFQEETDATAGLLLTKMRVVCTTCVEDVCICPGDNCTAVATTHRKKVYLERWLDCIQYGQSLAHSIRDSIACKKHEETIARLLTELSSGSR